MSQKTDLIFFYSLLIIIVFFLTNSISNTINLLYMFSIFLVRIVYNFLKNHISYDKINNNICFKYRREV